MVRFKNLNKEQIMEKINQSPDERRESLKELFKKHIGMNNPTSKSDIFNKVFGHPKNYTKLQQYFLWDRIGRDLNYLRRKTNYFIICRADEQNWTYYVVRNAKDAEPYFKRMDSTAESCKRMRKRCEDAVQNEFWRKL